ATPPAALFERKTIMSLHSWLENLQSSMVSLGRLRHHKPRRSPRSMTRRLSLEPLEDRRLLAFSTPVDYTVGANPADVKVADFNGDAIPDLAVAAYGSPGVSVLLGNADGTFQPARSAPAGHSVSIAVGDFDQDGTLDLASLTGDYSPGVRNIVSVLL